MNASGYGVLDIKNRFGASFKKCNLSTEERLKLIKSVAPACITEADLEKLLTREEFPIAYDGFEPSGRMHIAQGLLKAIKVKRITDAGCVFVFWIADCFADLNEKMSGDINKIHTVAKYFQHVWRALGLDESNIVYLYASEEIARHGGEYVDLLITLSKMNTIGNIKRCTTIMGRTSGDDQKSSQILYPLMQAADIFYIGANICQLGNDQHPVNMLAREYAKKKGINKYGKKIYAPVILEHEMLPGLLEGQTKMSKSNPDSSIFMDDTEKEIQSKLKKAYCPVGIVENNPIVAYVRMIVFETQEVFTIERPEKYGGNLEFKSFQEFETAYKNEEVHPCDVKSALCTVINQLINPVREYFANNAEAMDLLNQIKNFQKQKK